MSNAASRADDDALSKVPRVTLAFWIIKVLATTLGETGGDALSMQLKLGYAVATLIFLAFFVATVTAQVSSRRFHPLFYWACVVATTTVGTTTSDFIDRTLRAGYVVSSAGLFCLVVAVLIVWRLTTGKIAADRITTRPNEVFYWVTILVSNTLGTALGDFTSEVIPDLMTQLTHAPAGSWEVWGFELGAVLFGALIAVVAILHLLKAFPQAILFWAAYVLTRPLGATLGDTLTKPPGQGGLNLDRIEASLVIALLMIIGVWLTERGQARRSAEAA